VVDLVVGAAALAGSVDDSRLVQLPQNSLNRPLGDTDGLRDFTNAHVGVSGDADQYVPVIAEKSPRWWRDWFGITHLTFNT
jgi:hypothetical protein